MMINTVITIIVAATLFKEDYVHIKMMYISTQHKFILIPREAPSQVSLGGLCNIVTFLESDVGMSLLLSQSILLIS